MRFGILQRTDATRQRARTLMVVHPEIIGDVLHCEKKKMKTLVRECQETYGESTERLVLRLRKRDLRDRDKIRERATNLKLEFPTLRIEIDYLEEKWIFELLRRRRYAMSSDFRLEAELRQKD